MTVLDALSELLRRGDADAESLLSEFGTPAVREVPTRRGEFNPAKHPRFQGRFSASLNPRARGQFTDEHRGAIDRTLGALIQAHHAGTDYASSSHIHAHLDVKLTDRPRSERDVRDHMRTLERYGLVKVKRGNGRKATSYRANFVRIGKGKIGPPKLREDSSGERWLRELGTSHEPTVPPGGPGLFGMKGKQLPGAIQHVFNDLIQSGHPHNGRTYALAIGIVKNWSRGDDGKGNAVKPEVAAKARAAMAEWDRLRAAAKARAN